MGPLVGPIAHFLFGWFTYRVFVATDLREQLEQFLLLGVIYAFGMARFFYFYRTHQVRLGTAKGIVETELGCLFVAGLPIILYVYVTSWPFWVLLLTAEILFLSERKAHFLFALHAPIIYFAIIVAGDYLIGNV